MKVLALFHGLVLSKQEKRNQTAQIKKNFFVCICTLPVDIGDQNICLCIWTPSLFFIFPIFHTNSGIWWIWALGNKLVKIDVVLKMLLTREMLGCNRVVTVVAFLVTEWRRSTLLMIQMSKLILFKIILPWVNPNPELQRRFFEGLGGGPLILDPWFYNFFQGEPCEAN